MVKYNWLLENQFMEGFMTVQQAASKWEVTPRQIQLWCKSGKLFGAYIAI
jgi:hypothetical protein